MLLYALLNEEGALREKCPNTEFLLVRIFPHSDWIRRDTPYLSVFRPNAGKCGPEKTPYLETFRAVAHVAFNNYMTVLQTNNYKLNFGYFAVRVAVDLKLIWNWKFKPKKLFIHDGRFSTNEHNHELLNEEPTISNPCQIFWNQILRKLPNVLPPILPWNGRNRTGSFDCVPSFLNQFLKSLWSFFFILIHFLFYVSLN